MSWYVAAKIMQADMCGRITIVVRKKLKKTIGSWWQENLNMNKEIEWKLIFYRGGISKLEKIDSGP